MKGLTLGLVIFGATVMHLGLFLGNDASVYSGACGALLALAAYRIVLWRESRCDR